jgi:ubiquinone/menaquinone biosynthesis C-methylase UbiE
VVDRLFTEPKLAELYDAFCVGRPDFAYYLPMVMAATTVLDVGCGTGELLRLARGAGHQGRLSGLDPADAMLDVARASSDIEWVLGDLTTATWDEEFDLVVMTGHAFQVFVEDDELRSALGSIRRALTPQGRFAFETRNPPFRGWRDSVSEIVYNGVKVTASGPPPEVHGDLVSFTTVFTSSAWEKPEASQSTLRFMDAATLRAFLTEAGLVIEEQVGDWDGSFLTPESWEIITVASRGR